MFERQLLAMVLLKIGFAISAGLATYAIVYRFLGTAVRRIDDRILPAARYPLRAIFALLALMWLLPAWSELEPPLRSFFQHVASLGVIGMVAWLATTLINVTATTTITDRQNTVTLRDEPMRVCEGRQSRDRRACNLQVTDTREQSVSDLRWKHPYRLPRHRAELIGDGPATTSVSTTHSPPSRAHPRVGKC